MTFVFKRESNYLRLNRQWWACPSSCGNVMGTSQWILRSRKVKGKQMKICKQKSGNQIWVLSNKNLPVSEVADPAEESSSAYVGIVTSRITWRAKDEASVKRWFTWAGADAPDVEGVTWGMTDGTESACVLENFIEVNQCEWGVGMHSGRYGLGAQRSTRDFRSSLTSEGKKLEPNKGSSCIFNLQ